MHFHHHPGKDMQIDFEKLRRLELSAKDAHLLTMVASDRRDDIRRELIYKKNNMIEQWRRLPGFMFLPVLVQDLNWNIDRILDDPRIKTHQNEAAITRQLREIQQYQNELNCAQAEYETKTEHWRKLNAPIASLQEFAERYGRRRESLSASVADGSMSQHASSFWNNHATAKGA